MSGGTRKPTMRSPFKQSRNRPGRNTYTDCQRQRQPETLPGEAEHYRAKREHRAYGEIDSSQ